ncbi:MAG TPA: hypothetical protein VJ836_04835 [Candidatus Saccharimonadales bacterium]|nr:hypothetical protein [Candidatus Saccharimonadales bacterium]
MIIALTGNDGSGKTTLGKMLARSLAAEYRPVAKLEEFDYPLIRMFRKLAGPTKTIQTQTETRQGSKQPLSLKLLPYIQWADSLLQTAKFKLFARHVTVIKDRCAYDYIATWRELGVTNRFVEFLYRLLPKPDVTFYMYVEPATSLARRSKQPEKNSGKGLNFYQLKTQLYDDIYRHNRIALVDNNGNAQQALAQIKALLATREKLTSVKSIALSGLDGAGKTTTSEQLSELLHQLNVGHVVVHFYYNYLILKLLGLLKKKQPDDETARNLRSLETEKKHTESRKSKLWVMFVLSDAALQYAFYRLFAFRRLIVFDRFFHDYLVSFDFLKAPHNKQRLLHIFPKPDRYFLQIADYNVLHQRKPEHSPEFFAACYQKYQALARETGMIILDSTHQPPNQITQALLGRL